MAITLLGSCASKNPKAKMTETNLNEGGGYTEALGKKTLSGTPYLTKGAQIMLEGVILSDKATLEKNGLYRLSSEELSGYNLIVTGKINRYHCGPMEQCLSQGYIDSMSEIDKIEVNP